MIALFGLSLLLSTGTYFALRRLGTRKRLLWAAVVFIATFLAPMGYIMYVGDRPPAGSRVITPAELQGH